jgi:hypothetical protein
MLQARNRWSNLQDVAIVGVAAFDTGVAGVADVADGAAVLVAAIAALRHNSITEPMPHSIRMKIVMLCLSFRMQAQRAQQRCG